MKNKISILQIILLLISLLLITTGFILGDNMDMFRKAIFICMECIGLG